MIFFTAFDLNPDRDSFLVHTGEGLTRQSDLDSSNINNIVKRFIKTGELPPGRNPGQFIDVSDLNFQLMQNSIADARSHFLEQPYADYFSGPEEFLEFVSALENGSQDARAYADEIGLTVKNLKSSDLPTGDKAAEPLAQAAQTPVDKSQSTDSTKVV